jgi:ribosome-binding protein aMBF1 (putative translation factor)
MNPDRLRECLALLRWSQRGLADALAMDERQVRRWATGAAVIPEQVAAWLERRASAMAADPPPVRQAA